jgi:methionyl-tRNA formyltransferase
MNSRILFMGTPDFARKSLEALIDSNADIIGVVTQPDKPTGRKQVLTPPAVKVCALENNIPVYQPKTLRGEEFASLLSELNPDLIVVAAYGKILPENVINYPRLGCINVHGSLLPKYRGAAPIQRAIIDGENETGITIMYMDVGLDTGDMLAKYTVKIELDDDFGTLHDKLAEAGAKLLCETIEKIEAGTAVREKQDDSKSTYASKIENADCMLSFDETAVNVYNRIRGLSPVPLAVTNHNGRSMKIVNAELIETEKEYDTPGEVLKCDAQANQIVVACKKGSVAITRLLPEGKGRMNATDYINGRKISEGDILK